MIRFALHMARVMARATALATALAIAVLAAALGRGEPFNPYAGLEEPPPPLAADGTIQWGVFYKSAKLQQSYERLWSLGACRGSNKAITVPVAENKLVIDRLPETEFRGVVRAATGGLAGGMVAFTSDASAGGEDGMLVAQLHPAGVSRLAVRGTVSRDVITAGAIVRLQETVDARGRGTAAVRALEIVTPPADYVPDGIRPGHREPFVGTVVSVRRGTMILRIDAGGIRRVTLDIDPAVVVTVDAARLDLVAAGDRIEIKGRLWSGDGALEGGTVFASDLVVTKQDPVSGPGVRTVGAR